MKDKFIMLRKALHINQKQIAEYLEVDQSYISKIENGELNLTIDLAEKVCNLIGYDISYFYNDQDSLNISYNANRLGASDLRALARVNEIAMKLKEMKKIYQYSNNEKLNDI